MVLPALAVLFATLLVRGPLCFSRHCGPDAHSVSHSAQENRKLATLRLPHDQSFQPYDLCRFSKMLINHNLTVKIKQNRDSPEERSQLSFE